MENIEQTKKKPCERKKIAPKMAWKMNLEKRSYPL